MIFSEKFRKTRYEITFKTSIFLWYVQLLNPIVSWSNHRT